MLDSTRLAVAALEAEGDEERARHMQAYMKTEMAFFGIGAGPRKEVARLLKRDHPPATNRAYRSQVGDLWSQPWREAKYLAIDVARAHRQFITVDNLDLYERMIREGAWWDFVDVIAAHLVGHLTLQDRALMHPVLERWIDDDDMWIRRTAILAQLNHKRETNAELLFDFCLRRSHETEFFIRKAIGWALRQYARVNPDEVRHFVSQNSNRFAPLTIREATKHL